MATKFTIACCDCNAAPSETQQPAREACAAEVGLAMNGTDGIPARKGKLADGGLFYRIMQTVLSCEP